jgi:micrococcal nuclease
MATNSSIENTHRRFVVLWFFILVFSGPFKLPALDSARVVRVVDGDTIKILYRGMRQNVRLIGIDAPESRPNRKLQKNARRTGKDIHTLVKRGKKATEFVKKLLKKGDVVRLEFDQQLRDRYGRLLAYIYLANNRMLNEEILKSGYARPAVFLPNERYQVRFLELYKEARQAKRGLWAK